VLVVELMPWDGLHVFPKKIGHGCQCAGLHTLGSWGQAGKIDSRGIVCKVW